MHVLDQYEVESRSAYSGSFFDDIYYGSIFHDTGSIFSPVSASSLRYKVGSKFDGLVPNYRKSVWLYSDTLSYTSGSIIRGNARTTQHFTDNETYYDSYGPHPVDIFRSNFPTVYTWGQNINGNDELGIPAVSASDGIIFAVGNPGGPTISWIPEFPFMTKYKRFKRVFNVNYLLETKIPVDFYFKSIYGSAPALTNTSASQFGFLLFNGATTDYMPMDLTMSADMQISMGSSSLQEKFRTHATRIRPSSFNKAFFGFGDGLRTNPTSSTDTSFQVHLTTAPRFIDIVHSESSGGSTCYRVYGPLIRGFKYGLFNSNPMSMQYIFRNNRYGQFRDRLEQSYFSKTISKLKGKISIFRPIQITVTASAAIKPYFDDYKIATTGTWYNPSDSGIYDSEYRAGQPFSDSTSSNDLVWM